MVINKALEQGELTVREKSVRIQGIVKEKSGKFDLCVGFESRASCCVFLL